MVDESVITPELRARIGVETVPYVVEVERGDLRRFVRAVRGDVLADAPVPPTFFCPDAIIAAEHAGLARPRPFPFGIDGGSEWMFHRPVRAGDTLRLTARIVDLYEKQGDPSTGRMLFTVIEVRCVNQRDELVGVARGTAIAYEGSEGREGARA